MPTVKPAPFSAGAVLQSVVSELVDVQSLEGNPLGADRIFFDTVSAQQVLFKGLNITSFCTLLHQLPVKRGVAAFVTLITLVRVS